MSKKIRVLRLVLCATAALLVFTVSGTGAFADTASKVLNAESVGSAVVFNTNAYNSANTNNLGITFQEETSQESNLVMANVTSTLNVRAEANETSEKVGKLYKDCGGIVLEKGKEWSKIQSGDLIGWASNQYLFFGEEAEALAKQVGTMTGVINTDALRVRMDASSDAGILGVLPKDELVEVIEEFEGGWISIAYGSDTGYVYKDYVDVEFNIDYGETMEVINERKRLEEEKKKALIQQNEAIAADGDTERLMAAIIQCEAGGESYEGMLAVGSVVMNRVRSAAYPDTVYDVIYASGQFTPAKSGSLAKVYDKGPKDICYQAAQEVLAGYTNVGEMTHFRRKGNKEGYIIGNHVFY